MTVRLLAASTIAALGCVAPLTQVVLTLDTDLTPVVDVDTVRVVVRREAAPGAPAHDVRYDLRSQRFRFPGTLAVVARESDDTRPLEVTVTASRASVERLSVRYLARLTPDETSRLDVFLARACLDRVGACGPAQTCGRDGCEPVERTSLPRYQP